MLRELAVATGAQGWVIASMLFFLVAFLIAAALVWRVRPAEAESWARLPLASDEAIGGPQNNPRRADRPGRR
ncbi:MAG: hypothetical protein ABIL09_22045 [Gemmatimonadota bacterium]